MDWRCWYGKRERELGVGDKGWTVDRVGRHRLVVVSEGFCRLFLFFISLVPSRKCERDIFAGCWGLLLLGWYMT